MKKLELNQMEILKGGQRARRDDQIGPDPSTVNGAGNFLSGCGGASVGLALGFIGLVAGGTSVIGAGIGAAGFIYVSAQWGAACS